MHRKTLRFRHGFHLALGNKQSQAAEMTLAPGETEGGPENNHHGSDQWLYVVEGTGQAVINGHRYPLRPGSLILIERGDQHEVRAGKNSPLKTLNIYVPPAYQDEETELPAGRPSEFTKRQRR